MSEAPLRPIGVFGGTFDPVHFGHLRVAWECAEAVNLERVHMIPAATPPHRRPPQADDLTRAAMLRAALTGQERLVMDDRELLRGGISYTVDTLETLRNELGDQPLCLILGTDAFLGLPQWHRWEEIIELAHLVIAHRPGWTLPGDGPLAPWLQAHHRHEATALHHAPAGFIHSVEVTQLDISASRIRALVAQGREPRYLIPESVWNIIQLRGLYRKATTP